MVSASAIVIGESWQYRKELERMAQDLERWRRRKRLNERDFLAFERDVFYGAYIIRKLTEGRKLPDKIFRMTVSLRFFHNVKPVTYSNWDRIEENYDFSKSARTRVNLPFICNQLIHSYVFRPSAWMNGGLQYLYFASDRERNKRLFRIGVKDLVRIFRKVAASRPKWLAGVFNEARGDFDFLIT